MKPHFILKNENSHEDSFEEEYEKNEEEKKIRKIMSCCLFNSQASDKRKHTVIATKKTTWILFYSFTATCVGKRSIRDQIGG